MVSELTFCKILLVKATFLLLESVFVPLSFLLFRPPTFRTTFILSVSDTRCHRHYSCKFTSPSHCVSDRHRPRGRGVKTVSSFTRFRGKCNLGIYDQFLLTTLEILLTLFLSLPYIWIVLLSPFSLLPF